MFTINDEFINSIEKMVTSEKLPQFLYKYYTIPPECTKKEDNYTEAVLTKNSIWCGNAKKFNDPFDCQLKSNASYTKSEIIDIINKLDTDDNEKSSFLNLLDNPDLYPEFVKILCESISKLAADAGITSFTSKPNNLLMWAHYANNHSGFCLKFDVLKSKKIFTVPIKVKYETEYPDFKYLGEGGKSELIKFMFQTKSTHWKYEDEYRVLKAQENEYEFNKEALVEIIFGINTSDNNIEKYKKILVDNGYTTKVKFATKSDEKYELIISDSR